MRFFTTGLFITNLPLVSCSIYYKSVFAYDFEFTKIFKFNMDSAVSESVQGEKYLPRSFVSKSNTSLVSFDCLFEENERF
jgi:hypothetical protein